MNRNTEQHFTSMPKIHLKRSKFDMSHSHKTTFNTGDIIPIYMDPDILPGDTVEMDMAEVVRMATPIFPVMDNLFLDLMWFFVPNRLVMDHWVNFWGENDDPWTNNTEYEIPHITAPEGGWEDGTIADYIGVPTYVDNMQPSALPFRAYGKIWNDWFRDQNTMYATHVYTDDTNRTGSNGDDYVTDAELGGKPLKASKLHDYFTSCTPSAQKGQPVSIPLGTTAPVRTQTKTTYSMTASDQNHTIPTAYPLKMTALEWDSTIGGYRTANSTKEEKYSALVYTNAGVENQSTTAHTTGPVYGKDSEETLSESYLTPSNLWTDLSTASAATINQLRTAFAIQKYYEAATNGTRYIEILRNIWGVESSDARLQRSEYLGGKRIPINIDQVLQTSSTDTVSPQGNTGAFSCTISSDNMFTKSFEEFGILFCMAVVRTEHTYQQGMARGLHRRKWTDIYNPFFANLGNMAVTEGELYAQGTSEDDEAFGYQEAWADYRYKPSRISGHMRSNTPNGSLDAWHYADNYESKPTLSAAWMEEPKENVDRTIAVQSQISNQFIADFYFKTAYVRAMPLYSIPGLIDHV